MTTQPPKVIQVSCVQTHWARTIKYNLERTLHYIEMAAREGSRVVLFPESNLTGHYFPYAVKLNPSKVEDALNQTCKAALKRKIWVITGALKKTGDRFLNLAYVINPRGRIVHEHAKVHLAGRDELRRCQSGKKFSLFKIDGVYCTLAICRDRMNPDLYQLPAVVGARILFHPSCVSYEIGKGIWKRLLDPTPTSVGPETKIFHCMANAVGHSPDGKQTSSGASFICEPSGAPLAEAGFFQEEMITAALDLKRGKRNTRSRLKTDLV